MWTTKETKKEYRGVEIVKYEGSKMKDSFRKKDPRTFQSGDSKFTKWRSYGVTFDGVKYDFDKLKDVKEFIDSKLK